MKISKSFLIFPIVLGGAVLLFYFLTSQPANVVAESPNLPNKPISSIERVQNEVTNPTPISTAQDSVSNGASQTIIPTPSSSITPPLVPDNVSSTATKPVITVVQGIVLGHAPGFVAVPEQNGSFPVLVIPKDAIAPIAVALAQPEKFIPQDEAGKKAMEIMQQKFIEDVGGPNQNPNDPIYQKKWTKAQHYADEKFRAWFGNEAYVRSQIQAQRDANP